MQFLHSSVCLQNNSKSCGWISLKFSGNVTKNSSLNFGDDTDHHLDLGAIFDGISRIKSLGFLLPPNTSQSSNCTN